MIVRIEKSGGSFRGAGLYYLHDKAADSSVDRVLKPKTDERVWFTDTRNCVESNPERALDEMWRTAEDQNVLKRAAGVRTSGRTCDDPVKTISLSWHPDHRVTPEHMIESADAFLKHMGWHEHQVVYVAHRDTKHPHIHIILNRVHPETGRTVDDYREQKRAKTWRLGYEREHEQWRDKQRDTKRPQQQEAARHDHRSETPERGAAIQPKQPANDHLPHNVIMMSRPHEREFQAYEVLRAEHDAIDQKADLKIEQREERQLFFKDGAELFKATRHAVYDEVRKEYRAEWAALYKEAHAAEQSAKTASDSALSRAFHFAKLGQWEKAREAFGDRDSVRDVVAEEFNARFAELKDRQMQDLRERQRDACDQLREIRDIQYQELLQRQRLERATLQAGFSLDVLDIGRPEDRGISPANQNIAPDSRPPLHVTAEAPQVAAQSPPGAERADGAPMPAVAFEPRIDAVTADRGASIDVPELPLPSPDTGGTNKQVTDLVAGGIGSFASYVADQLGELFAPTPPEVREAQAKADAKREAEKPAPAPKDNAYEKIIAAAVRSVEQDQQRQGDAWWKERDRGKGWERDQ